MSKSAFFLTTPQSDADRRFPLLSGWSYRETTFDELGDGPVKQLVDWRVAERSSAQGGECVEVGVFLDDPVA